MNLAFPEMLFIFVLALLLFGAKKLPEIARQIGKAFAEFKRASNEFQWQLQRKSASWSTQMPGAKSDRLLLLILFRIRRSSLSLNRKAQTRCLS
jgi:TatA/E family protein of Tat protein translocase